MDEMKINVMYFVFTYALLAIFFFPVIFDMIAFLIVCMCVCVCVRMYARMFMFVYIPTGLVKLGVNGNIVGNVEIFSQNASKHSIQRSFHLNGLHHIPAKCCSITNLILAFYFPFV